MASLVFGLEGFEERVLGLDSATTIDSGVADVSFTLLVVLFEVLFDCIGFIVDCANKFVRFCLYFFCCSPHVLDFSTFFTGPASSR